MLLHLLHLSASFDIHKYLVQIGVDLKYCFQISLLGKIINRCEIQEKL